MSLGARTEEILFSREGLPCAQRTLQSSPLRDSVKWPLPEVTQLVLVSESGRTCVQEWALGGFHPCPGGHGSGFLDGRGGGCLSPARVGLDHKQAPCTPLAGSESWAEGHLDGKEG